MEYVIKHMCLMNGASGNQHWNLLDWYWLIPSFLPHVLPLSPHLPFSVFFSFWFFHFLLNLFHPRQLLWISFHISFPFSSRPLPPTPWNSILLIALTSTLQPFQSIPSSYFHIFLKKPFPMFFQTPKLNQKLSGKLQQLISRVGTFLFRSLY